jgi:phospholipid/cholesterol/gamma-HCH transport system ATP-binding protein
MRMSTNHDALITLQDVHVSFRGHPVLRGLNLDVQRGETLCVIGGSGCGKTVMLRLVIGLLRPDRGRIVFDGQDLARVTPKEMAKLRTHIGMVFQGSALFDSLTVGENVAFPLREHTHLDEQAVRERVAENLSLVGLVGIEDKKPAELSGGMKKRVALARAAMLNPEVILYDEPTTGLDPVMADVINELIIRTRDTLKTTSIVVTHDMTSAYKVADRIAMLYEGQVIIDGTPEEVRRTRDPVVRQFIEGHAGALVQEPTSAGSTP